MPAVKLPEPSLKAALSVSFRPGDFGNFLDLEERVAPIPVAIYATEALAELLGVELPTVEPIESRSSPAAAAHGHLVRSLATMKTDDVFLRHQLRTSFRVARHLMRVDEIGDAVVEADLDDLHELLGRRPADWWEAERRRDADDPNGEQDPSADQNKERHPKHLRMPLLFVSNLYGLIGAGGGDAGGGAGTAVPVAVGIAVGPSVGVITGATVAGGVIRPVQ